MPKSKSFFFKASSWMAVVALTIAGPLVPALATTAYVSTVQTGGGSSPLVLSATSLDNWQSSAAPGYANDPSLRMFFTQPSGVRTFTITVSATSNGSPVDMSNKTCFFRDFSGATTSSTYNGVVNGTVATSAANASSVTCTFTSISLIGSTIYVGDNVAGYGGIKFWLSVGAGSVASTPVTAAPIKYSGPEFTELNQKPALPGSAVNLAGRKLNEISTITVDGKAAKFSDATDKSMKLELPAGLKPGVYDLVVTTANHGKLTHMNAIRIREELPATSLTVQGTGVLTGEEFKKLTAFARTQNPEMNTVTCIVNSGSEGKSFTMARALCGRIAQNNFNIKTTQLEVRSTVESSAVFARVVFSSVQ